MVWTDPCSQRDDWPDVILDNKLHVNHDGSRYSSKHACSDTWYASNPMRRNRSPDTSTHQSDKKRYTHTSPTGEYSCDDGWRETSEVWSGADDYIGLGGATSGYEGYRRQGDATKQPYQHTMVDARNRVQFKDGHTIQTELMNLSPLNSPLGTYTHQNTMVTNNSHVPTVGVPKQPLSHELNLQSDGNVHKLTIPTNGGQIRIETTTDCVANGQAGGLAPLLPQTLIQPGSTSVRSRYSSIRNDPSTVSTVHFSEQIETSQPAKPNVWPHTDPVYFVSERPKKRMVTTRHNENTTCMTPQTIVPNCTQQPASTTINTSTLPPTNLPMQTVQTFNASNSQYNASGQSTITTLPPATFYSPTDGTQSGISSNTLYHTLGQRNTITLPATGGFHSPTGFDESSPVSPRDVKLIISVQQNQPVQITEPMRGVEIATQTVPTDSSAMPTSTPKTPPNDTKTKATPASKETNSLQPQSKATTNSVPSKKSSKVKVRVSIKPQTVTDTDTALSNQQDAKPKSNEQMSVKFSVDIPPTTSAIADTSTDKQSEPVKSDEVSSTVKRVAGMCYNY